MSVANARTARSAFRRRARSSAAGPGAAAAVRRTVMSRIRSGDATELPGRGSREEKPDAVPAGDLAAVRPAEAGADQVSAEAAGDERFLWPAVDQCAGRALGRRREGPGEPDELRTRGRPARERAAGRPTAERVRLAAGMICPVRPDRDVQRGGRQQNCRENAHRPKISKSRGNNYGS